MSTAATEKPESLLAIGLNTSLLDRPDQKQVTADNFMDLAETLASQEDVGRVIITQNVDYNSSSLLLYTSLASQPLLAQKARGAGSWDYAVTCLTKRWQNELVSFLACWMIMPYYAQIL